MPTKAEQALSSEGSSQTGLWSAFGDEDWIRALSSLIDESTLSRLAQSVSSERRSGGIIYPPEEAVFRAFRFTPLKSVKVVILGQDPYHRPGQADGLAFSVSKGKLPPSLRNIMMEVESDLDAQSICRNGCLTPWAKQGVLLLNSILTVREGLPMSHKAFGWEFLTDAVIKAVNEQIPNCVFILWGKPAQKKRDMIDQGRHLIIESSHPSPLSCYRGFAGSRPFSRTNEFLRKKGISPIEW